MPRYSAMTWAVLAILGLVMLAYSAPTPGNSLHHIVRVHVPYKVHHVHHHHVKKVPVYIKEYKAKSHHSEEEEFDDHNDDEEDHVGDGGYEEENGHYD